MAKKMNIFILPAIFFLFYPSFNHEKSFNDSKWTADKFIYGNAGANQHLDMEQTRIRLTPFLTH